MARPKDPQATHPETSDHGHAHPEPAESPEERAEREAAAEMSRLVSRYVARPVGYVLALGGAGLTLGFLGWIGDDARPLGWVWSVLAAFTMVYGLALLGSARESGRDASA